MPGPRQYIPRWLLKLPVIKQISNHYKTSVEGSMKGWGESTNGTMQ